MEEKLLMLKFISKNTLIRNHLEELIDSRSSVLKSLDSFSSQENYSEKFFKEIYSYPNHLTSKIPGKSEEYILDCLITYLTLDKKLYPLLIGSSYEFEEWKIPLPLDKGTSPGILPDRLDGRSYEHQYLKQDPLVISFMNENVDLFPKSAQRYIKSKQREFAKKPILNAISNEFEAKAFSRSLEDKFVKGKLQTHLKFFRNLDNNLDQLSSIFYFYISVREFYKGTDHESKCQEILESSITSFLHILRHMLKNKINCSDIDINTKIFKILTKDKDFLENVFSYIGDNDSGENLLYFLELASNDTDHKEKINKLIGDDIGKRLLYMPLYWFEVPRELQLDMINESKRQFFSHNPALDIKI